MTTRQKAGRWALALIALFLGVFVFGFAHGSPTPNQPVRASGTSLLNSELACLQISERYNEVCRVALNEKAKAAFRIRDDRLAAAYFSYMLAIREDAGILSDRGAVYAYLGEYAKALRDLDRAIILSPKLLVAISARAYVLLRIKQNERALIDAHTVIALSPDDPSSWALRAKVYQMMGDKEKSDADVRQANLLMQKYRPGAVLVLGNTK